MSRSDWGFVAIFGAGIFWAVLLFAAQGYAMNGGEWEAQWTPFTVAALLPGLAMFIGGLVGWRGGPNA